VVVGEIWDVNRLFLAGSALLSGPLNASEGSSHAHIRRGRIPKRGSRWLRWVVMEVVARRHVQPTFRTTRSHRPTSGPRSHRCPGSTGPQSRLPRPTGSDLADPGSLRALLVWWSTATGRRRSPAPRDYPAVRPRWIQSLRVSSLQQTRDGSLFVGSPGRSVSSVMLRALSGPAFSSILSRERRRKEG
jgi:hypothetical protein